MGLYGDNGKYNGNYYKKFYGAYGDLIQKVGNSKKGTKLYLGCGLLAGVWVVIVGLRT